MKLSIIKKAVAYRESPPARGAWIETRTRPPTLLLEPGRPLRGGRGLKLLVVDRQTVINYVAPCAGGVD